jgi:hypothetical protein
MRRSFLSIFFQINLLLIATAGAAHAAKIPDLSAFTHLTKIHDVAQGRKPRIAGDKHGLYVVFEERPLGAKYQDIFYVTSSDGGLTWTSPVNISNTAAISTHPDIAVEKTGAIDVIWCGADGNQGGTDIFFTRSSDGGKTWAQPIDISNTPGISTEPALATSPDNSIHVVWTDTSKGEKNKDIYYTSSFNGGKKWAKDPLLPATDISNTPGSSTEPAIAADEDGVVHVAWLDSTPGETHPDIYYVRKDNDNWSQPLNVSHSPRISDHPTIGCGSKGKVYVAWLDHSQKPTAPDIWCAIATKSNQFEKPINISNTPGVSGEPAVAADRQGRVAFVWTDTSKTFIRPDIFARISNDCGDDFTTVMDISNTPGISVSPDVIIVGDKMILVWEELVDNKRYVKLTSMDIKNLATGPPMYVDPTIHGASSNSR